MEKAWQKGMKNKTQENYLEKIPCRKEELTWSQDQKGIVTLEVKNRGLANRIAQKLLKNMNISTHIAEDPEKIISKDIDLGLRALLFGRDNYKDFLQNSMSEAENNTIYRFFDEYYCIYS